ncbi:hypothetical protein ACFV0Y_31485 [Streptomyces sp. NPDC059569]
MSETDGQPRPEKTLRSDNSPASPPPGGLPSDEPDSARQGDDQ